MKNNDFNKNYTFFELIIKKVSDVFLLHKLLLFFIIFKKLLYSRFLVNCTLENNKRVAIP